MNETHPLRRMSDPHCDGVGDTPGAMCLVDVTDGAVTGKYLLFTCPRASTTDRVICGVPIKPLAHPPFNTGWVFDGNEAAPTLTPSVNCTGGCKWHGFVRAGKLEGA
jgi:uncharacterized protein DUF6527